MTTLMDDVTVIGGVDTHKHTHYAAAIDDHGRLLGPDDLDRVARRDRAALDDAEVEPG